jgi:hypothetical protein
MKWIDPMDKVPTNYPVAFRADVSVYDPDVHFYGQASEYADLYKLLSQSVRWLDESQSSQAEVTEEEMENAFVHLPNRRNEDSFRSFRMGVKWLQSRNKTGEQSPLK